MTFYLQYQDSFFQIGPLISVGILVCYRTKFAIKRRMWELQVDGDIYAVQGKIGQGYTAEVYKAVSRNNKCICVKVINDSFYHQTMGKTLIENEIKIISTLSHPNLLSFIKKEHKNKLMIVTEYCSGGTLYDFLKKKGKIKEMEVKSLMKQIIEGCRYMHGQGYIHRDLKPQNIFIKDTNGETIKIADFGFAVDIKDSKLMSANVGSPLYMPYEALADMKFSIQSDVFALGSIWFELLTGQTPFQASTERQLKELTKKQQFRNIQLPCNQKTKAIIYQCLKFKPNQRPSLSAMLSILDQENAGEKIKSKTVYIPRKPILKVQQKKSASKENKDPLLCHPGVSRNQRCKTNLEKIKYIKPVEKNTQPLKLTTGTLSKQVIDESKKQLSHNCLLPKDKLLATIKCLSLAHLSFLPRSVQEKFNNFLTLYERLISDKTCIHDGQQAKQDELISSLTGCTNQQDFCLTSFGFLRRLLRLAKTYNTNIDALSNLWNHVQAKCLTMTLKA